jgi:hypothetical protein
MFYKYDRFDRALYLLARGKGALRERLEEAASKELLLIHYQELPDSLQEDFKTIVAHLTSVDPSKQKGSLKRRIDRLTDEQVDHLLDLILGIHEKMNRL